MARFAPSRLWLFLRRSSPLDRVAIGIVIGYVLLRLAGFNSRLPAFASFLGFLALIALVYLLVRLLQLLRRRMLWRLRNRLIVAYIFMGLVPVVLLLTMVTVGAYLLERQIGAHLLRDDLQDRVNIISADTNAIAAALN